MGSFVTAQVVRITNADIRCWGMANLPELGRYKFANQGFRLYSLKKRPTFTNILHISIPNYHNRAP
jgi:hypothetical protein